MILTCWIWALRRGPLKMRQHLVYQHSLPSASHLIMFMINGDFKAVKSTGNINDLNPNFTWQQLQPWSPESEDQPRILKKNGTCCVLYAGFVIPWFVLKCCLTFSNFSAGTQDLSLRVSLRASQRTGWAMSCIGSLTRTWMGNA